MTGVVLGWDLAGPETDSCFIWSPRHQRHIPLKEWEAIQAAIHDEHLEEDELH